MKENFSNFNKAKVAADPTQYSELPKRKKDLESVGKNKERGNMIVSDKMSGERYHEISDSPAVQMFVSHLVKGIVAVSDVVSAEPSMLGKIFLQKKKFYSKENTLTKIQEDRGRESLNADIFFMTLVFDEDDHTFLTEEEYMNNPYMMDEMGDLKHNLDFEKQIGTHTLYDFGEAIIDFSNTEFKSEKIERNNRIFRKISVLACKLLLERLELFRQRLDGEAGYTFFNSVVEKVVANGRPQYAEFTQDPLWFNLYKDTSSRREQYDFLCKRVSDLIEIVTPLLKSKENLVKYGQI